MSWKDSWSRPSKSSATPPPLYLTSGGEQLPYCHTCGRVILTRRSHTPASHSSQVKYCSDRCRHNKPTDADRKIEDAFVAILNNDLEDFKKKYDLNTSTENQISEKRGQAKKMKGDSRVIVLCSEVEELIFGSTHDPSRNAGRKKNRKPRGVPDAAVWKSVDMEDDPPEPTYAGTARRQDIAPDMNSDESDDSEDGGIDLSLANYSVDQDHVKLEVDSEHKNFGAGKRRPSQEKAVVNRSVGGENGLAEKIEESEEMLQKRRQGQRRAEEKEMVRRAARRGVAFGFVVEGKKEPQHEVVVKVKGRRKKQDDDVPEAISKRDSLTGKESRKKCEAVMTKAAVVVEPSHAKGDWGIRWREEV